MIHTKDHRPAHLHVIGPDGEVKFNIGTWEVMSVEGFSEFTVNRIRRYIKPRTQEFLEAWNEIHKVEKE